MFWRSQRNQSTERCDAHDISDEDLSRLLDFHAFHGRLLGGQRAILQFLKSASPLWLPNTTLSFLDVHCGQGALSRAIVDWARQRNIDVRVLAIDVYARSVHMARERSRGYKEIQFDVRDISDAMFLQAQQFDYTINLYGLHHEDDERAVLVLKTMNRLAKRGVAVVDFLRGSRARFWMKGLARLYGNKETVEDAETMISRGFTMTEMRMFMDEAAISYAALERYFGYQFALTGERGLVMTPQFRRAPGLAGA